MRKIVLYIAASFDGFIPSSDGSVDWIDTDVDLGDEYNFESFLRRVDTILMGRKSYEQALIASEASFGVRQELPLSFTLKNTKIA